jgi:hypothetical protein
MSQSPPLVVHLTEEFCHLAVSGPPEGHQACVLLFADETALGRILDKPQEPPTAVMMARRAPGCSCHRTVWFKPEHTRQVLSPECRQQSSLIEIIVESSPYTIGAALTMISSWSARHPKDQEDLLVWEAGVTAFPAQSINFNRLSGRGRILVHCLTRIPDPDQADLQSRSRALQSLASTWLAR